MINQIRLTIIKTVKEETTMKFDVRAYTLWDENATPETAKVLIREFNRRAWELGPDYWTQEVVDEARENYQADYRKRWMEENHRDYAGHLIDADNKTLYDLLYSDEPMTSELAYMIAFRTDHWIEYLSDDEDHSYEWAEELEI